MTRPRRLLRWGLGLRELEELRTHNEILKKELKHQADRTVERCKWYEGGVTRLNKEWAALKEREQELETAGSER